MTQLLSTTFKENPTPREKNNMILVLEKALEIVEAIPECTTCANCDHGWHTDGQYCENFKQNIPQEWQLNGCPEWLDQIPF